MRVPFGDDVVREGGHACLRLEAGMEEVEDCDVRGLRRQFGEAVDGDG